MITATICNKGIEEDAMLILKPKEAKAIIEALEFYCDKNKRKKLAKSILNKLELDCCCY